MATSLYAASGHTLWISAYITIACVLTVGSVMLLQETRGVQLHD